MWVYLDNWMVQDGEIPELRVGDTFRAAALRAACLSLDEAPADASEDLVEPLAPESFSGLVPYRATGTVEARRGPNEALLSVNGRHFLAEPADVRRVPGTPPGDFRLEQYSPDFRIPPAGARVIAVCTWEVLAEYETDFQELRADWRVRGLRVEHRDSTPVERRESRILSVDTVNQLERWADERDEERLTYLLDLEPVSG